MVNDPIADMLTRIRNAAMLKIPGVEIISEIGQGARGVVYRGTARGREVAVKVPLLANPQARDRGWLRQQVLMLTLLGHETTANLLTYSAAEISHNPRELAELLASGMKISKALGTLARRGGDA